MMTTNKLTKTFASGSLAIGVLAGSVLTATSAFALTMGSVTLTWDQWTSGTPLDLTPLSPEEEAQIENFARTKFSALKAQYEQYDQQYAKARYDLDQNEVKQYLQLEKLREGMFWVAGELFNLSFKQVLDVPVYHSDVRVWEVSNKTTGKAIGLWYFDPYARAGKRSGAWMNAYRDQSKLDGEVLTIVSNNCNFIKGAEGEPLLISWEDASTLFHEFGHGLHHMLTAVDELGVSGIAGVEWDAVELPSQFMENFCWEWDVLQHMTAHAESGESLPRALYDKMIAAKNFQSGLQMLRQVEFSLFDMHLHDDYDPNGMQSVADLLAEVRHKVAVIIPPAFNRFQNSFSHIFAGGYAAGYYSYKWAEVLSADAYSAFEEAQGDPNRLAETGLAFQREILSVGGSRPALESFTAFRGREPNIDALLRHSGMTSS
jgi:oligopeptidase A